MQTDLRLILLVVGLVIVAAIFLDGIKRRKAIEQNKQKEAVFLDPEEPVDSLLQDRPLPPLGPVLALRIIAKSPLGFSGKALLASIISHQLQYNTPKKIYDAYSVEKTDVLYHLASMVEPGIFERQTLAQRNYPGVLLFMVIPEEGRPCDIDLALAFETMLDTAYDMADVLNAEICDLQHEFVSEQQIEHIRFQLRERMMA